MVAATGDPASARFLDVLQGADAGASADPATVLHSASGTAFDGVATAGTAVLFPVDLATPFSGLAVDVPAGTTRALVTGLTAGAAYAAAWTTTAAGLRLTVSQGGTAIADGGGVLDLAPPAGGGGPGGDGGASSGDGGAPPGGGSGAPDGSSPAGNGGSATTTTAAPAAAAGGTPPPGGTAPPATAPPAALGLRALLAAVLAPSGVTRAGVLAAHGIAVTAASAVSGVLDVRWRLHGGALVARGRVAVEVGRSAVLHIRLTRAGRHALGSGRRVVLDTTATFISAKTHAAHRSRATLVLR